MMLEAGELCISNNQIATIYHMHSQEMFKNVNIFAQQTPVQPFCVVVL